MILSFFILNIQLEKVIPIKEDQLWKSIDQYIFNSYVLGKYIK